MKKSLVLGILGLAAGAVSSHGQGDIFLDNYISSTYNPVYYRFLDGGGILAPVGFTVGLYYDPTANANIVGSVLADPDGTTDPTSLNPAFVAATGPGSTATIITPGYFLLTLHSIFNLLSRLLLKAVIRSWLWCIMAAAMTLQPFVLTRLQSIFRTPHQM
jgi:hypothetical protein